MCKVGQFPNSPSTLDDGYPSATKSPTLPVSKDLNVQFSSSNGGGGGGSDMIEKRLEKLENNVLKLDKKIGEMPEGYSLITEVCRIKDALKGIKTTGYIIGSVISIIGTFIIYLVLHEANTMNTNISKFKSEIKQDISAFKEENEKKQDKIEAKLEEILKKINSNSQEISKINGYIIGKEK